MQIKAGISKKRIIYTVVFFFFCLIDQRIKTGSGLDGQIETFRALTGVGIAVLILSHYHLNDMKEHKIPYLVWSLICVIGGVLFIAKGQNMVYFMNERFAIMFNVFLYGIILFRTWTDIFVKKRPIHLDRRTACIWLVMMGLMCVSRSAYHWPALYLVMFGCFYLTEYTESEREDLFQGMLNGIILGFFVMQGWCFAFRPYDRVRYVGVHNNSNLNAIFYLVVLAAVSTRLVDAYMKNRSRWIKLYYWVGLGTVISFIIMTISRTGLMTGAVLTVLTLVFLWKVSGGVAWKSLLKSGLAVIVSCVILFPVVFCAVRYLPPLFHHPVWFFGEWSEDRVHSWDEWNSEKYVDFDEFLRTANKRIADIVGVAGQTGQKTATGKTASSTAVQPTPQQQQLYDEVWQAGYALRIEDKKDAVLVRKAIYRYYFHLLNFTGHPESEQGFQIFPTQRIGHAHNIYLQWGVDFGWPAMILFIILVISTIVGFVQRIHEKSCLQDMGMLLFFLVPCIFGLLEYAWGAGSLTITLLFCVWRRIICNETEKK